MNRRLVAASAAGLALALSACQPAPADPFADWLTCIRTVEPSDGELQGCDKAYADAGGKGTPTWQGVVD